MRDLVEHYDVTIKKVNRDQYIAYRLNWPAFNFTGATFAEAYTKAEEFLEKKEYGNED